MPAAPLSGAPPGALSGALSGAPHVHILMCTYNGAAHLQEQLDSFLAQEHAAWSLWVSDDGSQDATRAILGRFRAAHPGRDIRLIDGPCRGHAANFMSLLAHPELPATTTVALSDQDDVWLPHKLSRGLAQIAARPQGAGAAPVVYGCGSLRVTADLAPIDAAPLPRRGPGFANALVQNVLPGNCILLPPAALALLRRGPAPEAPPPFHDWWIYLLLTGAGAEVILDPEPGILYRQHPENVLGAHRGLAAAGARLTLVRQRRYQGWIRANLAALQRRQDCLTADNRALLAAVVAALDGPGGPARARAFRRLGLHRQTARENLLLYGLVLCGWV